METFQRDSEYIIRQAGLETLLLDKLPRKKIKAITNQASSKTKNYVAKYARNIFSLYNIVFFFFNNYAFRYFSQMDSDTLTKLLAVYGADFDLFGYNSTKYYELVQPSSTCLQTGNNATKTTTPP